jgi:hypothetical protein
MSPRAKIQDTPAARVPAVDIRVAEIRVAEIQAVGIQAVGIQVAGIQAAARVRVRADIRGAGAVTLAVPDVLAAASVSRV